MKSIYIYGASGHGLVVADIARSCGYDTIFWIDDVINQYPSFDEIDKGLNIPIVIAIGDNKIRAIVFNKILQSKMDIISLVHPSAVVSESVALGKGSVVMPNVVINAETKIGCACIINTASVIEHENTIGDFVHISPSASLAGNVTVLDYAHIGIGASIKQGIQIGKDSVVGVGSVVVKNIGNAKIAHGNPCTEKENII